MMRQEGSAPIILSLLEIPFDKVRKKKVHYAYIASLVIHLFFIILIFFEERTSLVQKKIPLKASPKMYITTVALRQNKQISTVNITQEKKEIIAQVESIKETPEVKSTIAISTPKDMPTPTKKEPKALSPSKKGTKASSKPKLQKPIIKEKSKNKPKTSTKPKLDQSLLEKALAYLDTNSPSENEPSISSKASTISKKSTVQNVGSLYSEEASNFQKDSQEIDAFCSTSPEGRYIADLIRRLQINIRLKEPGIVRLELTIKRNGICKQVVITKGSSSKVKKELEKALLSLKYAPFGSAFQKEQEHVFRLKLEDNGNWAI